jgi:hypothetical protein
VQFRHAKPRWKIFTGALSYEAKDSFNASHEGMVYEPDLPTRAASIKVVCPPKRTLRNPGAARMLGSGEKPMPAPEVSSDGKTVVLSIKRPRMGEEYSIFWDW